MNRYRHFPDEHEPEHEYRDRLDPLTNKIVSCLFFFDRIVTYLDEESLNVAKELIEENFLNCAQRVYIGASPKDPDYPRPGLRLKAQWSSSEDLTLFWAEHALRKTPEYKEKKKIETSMSPTLSKSNLTFVNKL